MCSTGSACTAAMGYANSLPTQPAGDDNLFTRIKKESYLKEKKMLGGINYGIFTRLHLDVLDLNAFNLNAETKRLALRSTS
jgi:hypothetical protein